MAELTTHRTLALRHALGERPDVAFLAALHALCLKLFYPYTQDTCLELDLRQVAFTAQPPGLAESEPAEAIQRRHQAWTSALPREAGDLWDALAAADDDTRQRLFAHCVSASVNAVQEAWNRRTKALAHAGRLAEAVQLDMAAGGGGQQGSGGAAGGGRRPSRAISAGSPRRASCKPCARPRARRRPGASRISRRAKWPSRRRICWPGPAGCLSRCARRVRS